MFDVIVVGKGLMGSAAFRYCSSLGAKTLLIGPDEPADPATHDGVFGAHYDQARLTHLHGKSEVWGELGRRSIEQYRHIEATSGIDFYNPVGELFVADPGSPSLYGLAENLAHSSASLDIDLTELDHKRRTEVFPFLAFPEASAVVWEKHPAGYINPRALIEAQVTIGRQYGGSVLSDQVVAVDVGANGVTVSTASGGRHLSDRVLVAAGSFSNAAGLLPEPLPLILKTESIVLGRVSEAEADRLAAMPVIHYDLDDATLANVYMVPPIRYPDGHHYIKLGANTIADSFPETVSQMCDWYARGDSDAMLTPLSDAVKSIVPGIEALGWHTGRCVIARTPSSFPIIKTMVPKRVFVAAGGNGSSAYCSDAIGDLAANLTVNGEWRDSLDPMRFTGV